MSEPGPIVQRGLHAHEGARAHVAGVHEGEMTHGDVVPKNTVRFAFGVQHAVVLDIGALADADGAYVAAQHAAVEHGGIGADLDVSDDGDARSDVGAAVDTWGLAVERQDQGAALGTVRAGHAPHASRAWHDGKA